MKILSPSVDEFVFSQIEGSRAFSAQELEASLKRISSSPRDVSCDTHLSLALEKLVKRLKAEDVLLITGSFYIIGEARTWLKNIILTSFYFHVSIPL
ncbi:MAG: hypothetical protein IPJ69_11300 [Deltaproteobacteria bacterium]|nr:MAG: hypothetical protein IPJ69_11300 [Deltaproteobacteria bacterium]